MYGAPDDAVTLRSVIRRINRVLPHMTASDPLLGLAHAGRAQAYRYLVDRTNSRADVQAAVDAAERAVATLPPDDPQYAAVVSLLGDCYLVRYEATADPADLDTAVRRCEESVNGGTATVTSLARLARAYQRRLGNTRGPPDPTPVGEPAQQGAGADPTGGPR